MTKPTIETRFERGLFASRWLMAPMYLGLVVSLAMLLVTFLKEIAYYAPQVLTMTPDQTILAILTLIDLSLAANLLLIVLFSGYENFVSQLDINEGKEKLSWLGKMDATSLKNKVAASIVAISSIHLLRVFMDAKNVPDNKLMWYVIIHLTFVLSAFVMGYLDRLNKVKH